MLQEIKNWGVEPEWVTGDSWYSSLANLKFLRNEEVGFLFGVADNRKVSLELAQEVEIQSLTIPESGLVVYLKKFGWMKLFSKDFKNEARYYMPFLPELEALKPVTRESFKQVHERH
jgi:hypothetical protein